MRAFFSPRPGDDWPPLLLPLALPASDAVESYEASADVPMLRPPPDDDDSEPPARLARRIVESYATRPTPPPPDEPRIAGTAGEDDDDDAEPPVSLLLASPVSILDELDVSRMLFDAPPDLAAAAEAAAESRRASLSAAFCASEAAYDAGALLLLLDGEATATSLSVEPAALSLRLLALPDDISVCESAQRDQLQFTAKFENGEQEKEKVRPIT